MVKLFNSLSLLLPRPDRHIRRLINIFCQRVEHLFAAWIGARVAVDRLHHMQPGSHHPASRLSAVVAGYCCWRALPAIHLYEQYVGRISQNVKRKNDDNSYWLFVIGLFGTRNSKLGQLARKKGVMFVCSIGSCRNGVAFTCHSCGCSSPAPECTKSGGRWTKKLWDSSIRLRHSLSPKPAWQIKLNP